jgi:organic hydroperoxide reductase OsmC/OhrA
MSSGSPSTHHAEVVWSRDRDDLRAHVVRLADQTVLGSSAAALGGNSAKADPEELFVAALSACHMLWFLDFARRDRLRVRSYEDRAEGTMDGERFTHVVLKPAVAFEEAVDRRTLTWLHQRAHETCFIAKSVSCDVEVEPA